MQFLARLATDPLTFNVESSIRRKTHYSKTPQLKQDHPGQLNEAIFFVSEKVRKDPAKVLNNRGDPT